VVVNKAWPCASGRSVGCVQADHGRLMEEAVSELAGRGRRSLVFVVDPSRIDANRRMLEGFERAMAARRGQGICGRSVRPEKAATLWDMRPACDGVITDGLRMAEEILAAARVKGLAAGRDFDLIGTSTEEGATTASRQERSVYAEQPERMGGAAWAVMKGLIEGAVAEREVKVPYVRYVVGAGA